MRTTFTTRCDGQRFLTAAGAAGMPRKRVVLALAVIYHGANRTEAAVIGGDNYKSSGTGCLS